MKRVEQGRWHTHRLVQRCRAALVEGRRPTHPGMHRGRMRGGGTAAARRHFVQVAGGMFPAPATGDRKRRGVADGGVRVPEILTAA